VERASLFAKVMLPTHTCRVSETGTKDQRQNLFTIRRVVVGVIVLYVVLFFLLNTRRIHVNFVVFSVRTHLLTALFVVAVLSFIAGFLVRGWSQTRSTRSRRRTDRQVAPPPAAEPQPVEPPERA
jgi:uncharacterized integral membrane protein